MKPQLSAYAKSFELYVKQRYLNKISIVGSVDPFIQPTDSWSDEVEAIKQGFNHRALSKSNITIIIQLQSITITVAYITIITSFWNFAILFCLYTNLSTY